jgi:hypothetical protein
MSFSIHRERDISDIYNKVEEWLRDEKVLSSSV